MPYYMNPRMLALHYEKWMAWPEAIKARTEVVIVDDGSPSGAAIDVERSDALPKLTIYRVREDTPWHQTGARNLGAHVAAGTWLLLTDMDHVLPASSAEVLFRRMDNDELDEKTIYTMARIDAGSNLPTLTADGQPKPHQNSYAVTRETYWTIGGYDESLCGLYGTDGMFRWRAHRKAEPGHLEDVVLARYTPSLVADAETIGLPRKEGRDDAELARRKGEALLRGIDQPVPVLQFQWERIL